ncbi:hypothetical protein WMF04_06325 [Sorangium sp. So ce260]|uniref:hypothetical protein n=1 Tax=Sorangium sp. So ce260 TaxID=3133291 RepID=UPI003F612F37
MQTHKQVRQKAAEIVRDAGGEVVGRTKLQKIAYLLELAGLGEGFPFEYRHYGPYSEELADAIQVARVFGLVNEEERPATWGGSYSIFRTPPKLGAPPGGPRAAFAELAARIDSIELELAATAAYLHAVEGHDDPWEETARRKPEKAKGGRLDRAKDAYRQLLALSTPRPLPAIV